MSIVDDINKEIKDLQDKLIRIQEECTHPDAAVERVAGSSTGNLYADDYYWYNCTCGLCGKTWTEK